MARRSRRSGSVAVKGHSRSPRGANRGKSRPKVKSYTRSRPDPGSYPRTRGRRK